MKEVSIKRINSYPIGTYFMAYDNTSKRYVRFAIFEKISNKRLIMRHSKNDVDSGYNIEKYKIGFLYNKEKAASREWYILSKKEIGNIKKEAIVNAMIENS